MTKTNKYFNTTIEFFRFSKILIFSVFTPPFRFKEIIKQINFVANESAFIIIVSVAFAAGVTIMESSFHMNLVVQDDSMVPGFAALLILRELGTVVTLLLLASRVGTGWAAEIGTMKITEQLDALKLMGLDPIRFLGAPRFIAAIIGGTIITAIANIICLLFAMFISMHYLDYTVESFISAMNTFTKIDDYIFAVVKGGIFSTVIPLVSVFSGFKCESGAEGVGKATTNSLVTISVIIIILDFFLNWFYTFIS